MRRVERIVLEEWLAADTAHERRFPHEFLYRVLRSKVLEPLYEIDPASRLITRRPVPSADAASAVARCDSRKSANPTDRPPVHQLGFLR